MLFTPWQIGAVRAPNRLWRAATYEGLADARGCPMPELGALYARLAGGGAGAIITGFCYVSRAGRAMQPRQCGIDADEKIAAWQPVVAAARAAGPDTLLFMQIAHAGRQTLEWAIGGRVLAPTRKASPYFRSRPMAMSDEQIRVAIREFVAAARRAQFAGFDGVELHAAHGYLIHQFLSPHLNDRRDAWGRDRLSFLREIVEGIRGACGDGFPLLVKISAGDFHRGGVDTELAADYAARLAGFGVAAIEVSCGTMDLAMNIFRGGLPIRRAFEYNPLFTTRPAWQRALWTRFALPRLRRRLEPFREAYNREAARAIRRRTTVPLVLVGGLRSRAVMEEILDAREADAVALCRPWVREPNLGARLRDEPDGRAACVNCNLCAVMCDSTAGLRCYRKEKRHDRRN
jgi:2,4-dienoyl-CoA reductase-like NADH-dependent reductase (Old Yellow Enzyme family)